MKCVLVGGTGFVGSDLAVALTREGHQVAVTYRHDSVLHQSIVGYKITSESTQSDLENAIKNSDVVVILSQPDLVFAKILADAFLKYPPKKIVYISSLLVYPNSPRAQSEDVPSDPITPYEEGKVEEEKLFTKTALNIKIPIIIARLGNVYGPGAKKGIVFWLLNSVVKNTAIQLNGDGSSVRDYIYIDDVVRWLRYLIINPTSEQAQIYNLCSGIGTSVSDLLKIINSSCNVKINAVYGPNVKEKKYIIGNNSKISLASNQNWRVPLSEGLKLTFSFVAS